MPSRIRSTAISTAQAMCLKALLAALLNDKPLEEAMGIAVDYTRRCIVLTPRRLPRKLVMASALSAPCPI